MAGRSGLPRADPLDVGADGLEFLLKPLVTAVEMIDAIDLGLSFGSEAGDDQAHRCAAVGRHDRCSDQMVAEAHPRAAAEHVDVAPHARQLRAVALAVPDK